MEPTCSSLGPWLGRGPTERVQKRKTREQRNHDGRGEAWVRFSVAPGAAGQHGAADPAHSVRREEDNSTMRNLTGINCIFKRNFYRGLTPHARGEEGHSTIRKLTCILLYLYVLE